MSRISLLKKARGFTIVELLIVIVVIGILAAVVIVAYRGVTNSATDRNVQSDADDLDALETQYGIKNNVGGEAWYSGSGVDANLNFLPSKGDVIDVVVNSTDYCIRIYNANSATYNTLATAYTKGSTATACTNLAPSASAQAVSPLPFIPPTGNVTTLAGGTQGTNNGTGSAAQFGSLSALTVDHAGNVYASDGNEIREITTAGVVTTFAGSVTQGSANGTLATATFYDPAGMVFDSAGNMYVADYNNNLIRKITPAGVVSTYAGVIGGACTDTNGTVTTAKFCEPYGLTIDISGTLYVSDIYKGTIREISTSGNVTTLAGSSSGFANGTGTAAKFNGPMNLVLDSAGNVYVADYNNYLIRKITPAGVVSTFAGKFGTQQTINGTGTNAAFAAPEGITIDSAGNLYTTDFGCIRKITPAGVVTILTGNQAYGFADGGPSAAEFEYPWGIVASGSTLYVADTSNYAIRQIK